MNIDEMEEKYGNPILLNYKAKVAREKAVRNSSRAKEASWKQINYLRFLLEYPSQASLESFVRFANGYYAMKLTSVHYMQAIALAKDGHNWYGTSRSLMEMSYE